MTVREYAAKVGMDERNLLVRVHGAKVVAHVCDVVRRLRGHAETLD
jgi:hypothetical protein